jgi:hypothetical protein
VRGTVERHGSGLPSGSAWLDEPGRDEVVVRVSRAIGLPDAVPDIHGLAVRVPTPAGVGDLLFASTGWGLVGRFVLTFGGGPESRPMTTLLPYRTARGPALLGVRAIEAQAYEMSWCRPRGEWHAFAELRITDDEAPNQAMSLTRCAISCPASPSTPGYDVFGSRRTGPPGSRAGGDRPHGGSAGEGHLSFSTDGSSSSRRLLRWCWTISLN